MGNPSLQTNRAKPKKGLVENGCLFVAECGRLEPFCNQLQLHSPFSTKLIPLLSNQQFSTLSQIQPF